MFPLMIVIAYSASVATDREDAIPPRTFHDGSGPLTGDRQISISVDLIMSASCAPSSQ